MKTIVLWWLRISSRIAGWMAGQMLVRRSGLVAGPPGWSSGGRNSPMAAMSSTGTTTSRSSGLAGAGIDDGDLATGSRAGQEPADGLERPLRGGEADALGWWQGVVAAGVVGGRLAQPLEAFQAEGEVGTPFRAGDRVDLVHDDVLDTAEDLAGLTREHQVEAFGGRDEDVRRTAGDLAAVLARGVAGAARDADVRRRLAASLGREPDPRQRRPQVALHVVGQGLERGDVEDPDVAGLRPGRGGARVPGETVQAPQEGGQGLATPRRGVDERVVPRADRRPAFRLRLRRRLEARLEPVADRR